MSMTNKKEQEKELIERNLAAAASAAAELLEGFGTLSRVGYITTSSLLENRQAVKKERSDNRQENKEIDDNSSNALAAISATCRVNPLLWKPQIEHIALLNLRESCELSREGETAHAARKFNDFADAIMQARAAGPTSTRTRSAILDVAHKYRDTISLMHMALNSHVESKEKLVNLLLDAGINPEFRVHKSDLSALALAEQKREASVSAALLKGGATKPTSPGVRQLQTWDASKMVADLCAGSTNASKTKPLKLN